MFYTYIYIDVCLPTYIHIYIHATCMQLHLENFLDVTCMYACMHLYVAGMSMNATGMSIHPFPVEFLCFDMKIPSLLDF